MEIQPVLHERSRSAVHVRLRDIRAKTGHARNTAIARFTADRRGATALFVALVIVALIGTIGLAVDGTRLAMVQSRLKTSVDAAALIAARDITTLSTTGGTNATNLFWANFGRSAAGSTQGFLGTNITKAVPTPISADTVSFKADGLMPTTFMSLLGVRNVAVTSSAQATRAATGLELALVLDNTGSMDGWPIQSAIDSATALVNVVYGNGAQDTQPNLWVSVVPFSAEVNIGASHTGWLKAGSNITGAYMNRSWMGCVMARYDTVDPATGLTNDFTDVPPGVAPFTPYLYPSTYGQYVKTVTTGSGKNQKTTTYYYGDNDWQPGTITEQNQSTLPNNTAVGPNLGCPQSSTGGGLPILPETASRTAILAEISQMVANYRGGTFINLGLQAGWWTLSPRWRGAAGWGDPKLPLDYNTPHMKKIIVLMTDGNNEWFDYPDRAPGACYDTNFNPSGNCPIANWNGSGNENDGNTDFTAYKRLLNNTMGLPAGQVKQSQATTNINNKMSQLCQLIKQNGIIIYTILFNHGGSVSSATQTLFQNCASAPQNYFLDVTDADLQATFSKIGGQLASLRLSQ